MCVLADRHVRQNLDPLPGRRQPVVTRKRTVHVISDTLHPSHDMRRQGFDQGAFKKCNHLRATLNRVSAKLEFRFLIFVSALLAANSRADETEWRVFLEPKFLRAPVTSPIPSARKTDVAAGRLADGEL